MSEPIRKMYWADIVPLGYYATWEMKPNSTLDELLNMMERARRIYSE